MAIRHKSRATSLRTLVLYLLAIVAPTLVLLYLGLQSVDRQHQAIGMLTATNLRLSADRLASEIESRALRLAEACLRDVATADLSALGGSGPLARRALRLRLEPFARAHPIARHFFVLQGNTALYPSVRDWPERSLETLLASADADRRERYEAHFREGETLELRLGRAVEAVRAYRKCYEAAGSDELRALALARTARALEKAGDAKDSAANYRLLRDRFADVYDLFDRPYGVIAALELHSRNTAGEAAAGALGGLRDDLLRGRWEIGLDQLDYFLSRSAGAVMSRSATGAFAEHLRFAAALEERFRHHGPLRAGEVYGFAASGRGIDYQTYYTPIRMHGREMLLGFAAELDWVRGALADGIRREFDLSGTTVVARAGPAPADGAGRIGFARAFPFWEVAIEPALGDGGAGAPGRDMLVFAGSTLLILCVLVLGVVLLTRDVSREAQLNRLRSEFVSGVTHELKTPLTLIRLYAETLLHGHEPPEAERRGYYAIITRESERLTNLIEKVLDFSRVDRGQRQYQLREGDLGLVVRRTVEAYTQYLRRRGFEVDTRLDAVLPAIRLDAEAVCQAIVNLLDNAVKYSGDSRFVGVYLRREPKRAVFEVGDRGIGIPAAEREKIFQRFYRVRNGAGKGGYGLGLFLVRHIMEAHGGTVEVESEAGGGSRFRLVFPIDARTEIASVPPAEAMAADGGRE